MQYNVKRTTKHRKTIELLRKTQYNMRKKITHILPTNNRHLMSLKKSPNNLMLNE